jgi:hypothetical protein
MLSVPFLFCLRDLHEIIEPKNTAAGLARCSVFGFYTDHFFLGFPYENCGNPFINKSLAAVASTGLENK